MTRKITAQNQILRTFVSFGVVFMFLVSLTAENSAASTSQRSFFQPVVTYSAGGIGAGPIAVADLNGDGKLDLAVGNTTTVSILLGNGDGTFSPAVAYNAGAYGVASLAIADVNGDKVPDLLVADFTLCGTQQNGCVAVLLGNGDGTFGSPVTYDSGGPYSYSLALGDFNADGKLDVVVTDCGVYTGSSCGLFGVLLGNGDGTFNPVTTYNSGGVAASAVTVGDVNLDGKLDLVIGNLCQNANCTGDGVAAVFLGNGDGTFQPPVTYPSEGHTHTPVIADVNGDGKPDIVVANTIGRRAVAVFLGNGDGTFQPVVTYPIIGEPFISSLTVADVNGDGKLDVVVADCSGGQYTCQVTGSVSVLLGNGNGSFRSPVTLSSGGLFSEAVAVADLNRDGRNDIVVTNCTSEGGMCGVDTGLVGVLLRAK